MPFFIVSCIAGISARVLLHTYTDIQMHLIDTYIDIGDTRIHTHIHNKQIQIHNV